MEVTSKAIKFELGKAYTTRHIGDADLKETFRVTKLSASFATLDTGKRCKIHSRDGVEFCYPDGQHSMCLVLKADRAA